MYIYGRGYVNAGTNEFYKWGKKAQEKLERYLTPNENGFYRIPVATKYWTIGTSEGKYGEFAKFGDTFFSVNSNECAWAKVGTPKAEVFIKMINTLLQNMKDMIKQQHENYLANRRAEDPDWDWESEEDEEEF